MARRSCIPPKKWSTTYLKDVLPTFRTIPEEQQNRLILGDTEEEDRTILFYAGDLRLLQMPAVSVIGTRKVSEDGAKRASRVARELAQAGVLVVSGLADGVDTCALESAINAGGKVCAVIGTPLDKAYPAKNKKLQELIYKEHLLISPFEHGRRVFKANFPHRNKIMAALSDASIIVEAGPTSGTIHQAAECIRLERELFFMKSLADAGIEWVDGFIRAEDNASPLERTSQVLDGLTFEEMARTAFG